MLIFARAYHNLSVWSVCSWQILVFKMGGHNLNLHAPFVPISDNLPDTKMITDFLLSC